MFKLVSKVLNQTKTFNQVLPKILQPSYTPKFNFNAYAGDQDVLTKHHRELKLYQYRKTQMRVPENLVKIDMETLQKRGFITFIRHFGEFAEKIEVYEAGNTKDIPGKNTPSGSYIRIKLPLQNDPNMRNQFVRSRGSGIRIGRLLELLDYLAGMVSYKYAKSWVGGEATMATACVDQFEIFESKIDETKDLYLTGYVCYVGRSSMEIRVDVSSCAEKDNLAASAYYVFVSRDSKDSKKSLPVPELVFDGEKDTELCFIRQQYGKKNQVDRKNVTENSVFKTPPTYEEGIELHSLFKEWNQIESKSKFIPIPETTVEKNLLMHVEDKNLHGKVFGGHIMREAAELAWVTSYMFDNGRSPPEFVHVDDVLFMNPVEIGCIACFEAKVTYVENNFSNVVVTVDTTRGDKKKKLRTCELHIAFAHDHILQPVIPLTYFDAMSYLEGKRRYLSIN